MDPRLRTSTDPRLKGIGILIRPHPARLDEWRGVDVSDQKDLVFWGAHPVDAEAKDDYFDSMYYCAAVVGINTSAFLEAAVVGKPVHTVLLPEVSRDNQEGTLHFRYLLNVNGGLLRAARSFDEHLAMLADSLAPAGGGDEKAARFVEGFVRPYGRGDAATPRFVAAIEEAAALPVVAPEHRSVGAWLAFLVMYPIAAVLALHLRSQPWRKRTRHRATKWLQHQRTIALRRVKRFAIERLGAAGKQRKSVTAVGTSALTPKTGRQRDPAKTLAGTDLPEARHTRELVTVIGRSNRPIIVGPWLSETGFELLYWIPFVAWAKAYGNFDPSRMVVVSRGGAAPWYRHITSNYEEIFSFYTPDEFRARNEGRIEEQEGRQKHLEMSSFDREIIGRVERKLGLKGAEVLHPSLMYQLFDHYWYQRTPVTLVEAFTSFEPLTAATGSDIRRHLPDRYVAAKFYGNAALPSTPANGRFVASYLADLARHNEVVLLDTAHRFDEHADFPRELLGRVHAIDHLMDPAHNLAVQTEVIRHADAFVGTYGGFSDLAPLCGVNTVAFYSHPNGFRVDHLEVAKRVFSALKCGTFTELDLRAVDSLRLGLAGQPARAHRNLEVSDLRLALANVAHKHARRAASRGRRALKLSIEGVKDGWHAARRQIEGARDTCINVAKDAFRRVRRPLRAASRHRSQMREQQQFYRTEWSIEHELETLVARGRRLVVGPWLSEVGFEALYWVPFLHWLKSAFNLDPDRVVAVSRGGVGGWYDGVAGRYVEIWDHVDPAAFARRNAERGATKQIESSDFDREILDHVARQIGTRDFDVIHPQLMYRLFTLYWSGQRAMGFLDAHTRFTRMEAPPVIDPALLPREYVAVKFYAARSLPDTPIIRAQLRSMLAAMARETPVVLLDTGLVLEDDHADYAFDPGAQIISAKPWMTPQNNLGVQTQIAAGAKAFVGTCGSITWLVPRLGVDTSAVFVDPKWLHAHLPVAMRAAHKLDAGRFAAADLRAFDPWNLAPGRIEGRA